VDDLTVGKSGLLAQMISVPPDQPAGDEGLSAERKRRAAYLKGWPINSAGNNWRRSTNSLTCYSDISGLWGRQG
jgi:hypothetical protein